MPIRGALGEAERDAIEECIAYYAELNEDPGYQGEFEQRYTDAFVAFMNGGYADAVATGTAALFVAIRALALPPQSEVIVSPITDPGSVSAIVLNGLIPCVADSAPNSYNIDCQRFVERITPSTSAVLVVHACGRAVSDIADIARIAHTHRIRVIEDCSQAHGASVGNARVGTFGDIAAFSTMYRKAHMSGGSGGIVYTRDLDLHRLALAHADRGKPRWLDSFDDRDPRGFLFPALNLHTNEISCAIGEASLKRLPETIMRRLAFVAELTGRLRDKSRMCTPYGYSPNDSPFIEPIFVNTSALTKIKFANALATEGIALNPHYQYLVCDWPWMKQYIDCDTPNARDVLNRSFVLYLNENYGTHEVQSIMRAIERVERKWT